MKDHAKECVRCTNEKKKKNNKKSKGKFKLTNHKWKIKVKNSFINVFHIPTHIRQDQFKKSQDRTHTRVFIVHNSHLTAWCMIVWLHVNSKCIFFFLAKHNNVHNRNICAHKFKDNYCFLSAVLILKLKLVYNSIYNMLQPRTDFDLKFKRGQI